MARGKGKGTLQRERNGTWTIRATINGIRKSKSTGTTDHDLALKKLDEFMAPYVRGDDVRSYQNFQAAVATIEQRAEIEEDKKPQLKLVDAWPAYVDSPLRRDLAQSTLYGKKQTWDWFVDWMTEHIPEAVEVRHVKAAHVELFLKHVREGHAASTYNNRVCVLREMYRVLMPKARAKVNPFEGVKLLADDSHTRRELTVEELKRLIECAARVSDEYRKLFGIGIYTGLRLGDCCNLNWKNVDVVRSIIQVIPKKTAKYAHGKPVTIPIHPTLSLMFQETPVEDRTGYVLPNIQAYYAHSRSKVANHIKRIFNDAGIITSVKVEGRTHLAPEATFHSFRHTFVSLSANAGVPLHIVQEIVGHESTTMTRHYYHQDERALRQAVAAIPTIGETYGANDSALPFAKPDPAALIPEAPLTGFDADKGKFIENRPQAAIEAETVPTPQPVAAPAPVASAPVVATPMPKPEPGKPYAYIPRTRQRPPKAEWMGQVMKVYGKRHGTGVLDGTMKLVANGGYKFLGTLWEKGAQLDAGEAIDLMEAFLVAKGAR